MSLAITVKSKPIHPDWAPMVKNFFDGWGEALADAHLKWVFLVLEYTQKYSRVDTGRSRAAWTKIMDKYGYDYQRSMPIGPRQDEDAISEGKGMGSFYDDPFNTTIVNNVNYVDPMNRRYGLFGWAPARATLPEGRMGEISGRLGKRVKLFGVNEYGNRVTAGIRFEEKVPLFESYGQTVFQKIADNAKVAFEDGETFSPKEIDWVENDPPMSL